MSTPHVPVDPSEFIAVGPLLVKLLSLAHRGRLPALLEGATGIGKSEIVHQVARQLGIQCVVLDLSLLEPPDLIGLPRFHEGLTTYAPPAILPREGDGILLLEELNRAERYIQQPALQLLSARCLNDYRLPDGWSVVAAINPETEDYIVNPLDPALRKRFLQLRVTADTDSWLAWARENGIHPTVLRLAEIHDRMLVEVPPRSWAYASQLLAAMDADELADSTLLRRALEGYLRGPWAELMLQEHMLASDDHGIDAKLLIKVYHESSRLQERVRDSVRSGRTDRIDQLYRSVYALVSGPSLGARIEKELFSLEGFEAFLADLPGDLREGLQEAFGGNPAGAALLPFDPDTLILGYGPRSRVRRRVQTWAGNPMRRHRALALASAVETRLKSHTNLSAVRGNDKVRKSLGQFVTDLRPDAQHLFDLAQALDVLPTA
jgi:MoxR-like ATPase